ncbi:ABC transporter ATP-binding protein [Streptococcus gallolyticus]|uniref:ABC transporter ATP-binding protein n=1 Tax=Streptococcus gallolyticus TaxID=315405 RepID=UPI0001E0F370|nr:ABC transporter ATP-binding protein [Streptococcus gallolyticus]EFM29819.1 ABC transporter, ATP-binding protein [Streptococcus gallolyticus subsp. gallolyticus TX20005]QKI01567.1 ABC transporter ATP-binding protein [Streptococcus gallolyticus]QWX87638.1 ABC transporter ATP-binding protein/permease [Streptococcus gallolyticus subsp. gallolyticus TX20005]
MAQTKKEINKQDTLKRVLAYVLKNYKWRFLLVLVLILVTALCMVRFSLFMQTLIDSYITPLLSAKNPDFSGLAHAIFQLIIIGIIGVLSSYTYNRLMVYVGQGTMRRIRIDLFTHMERLPIKYFDTHAHGDIMSIYTNDVDTLRQLISQSIPQVVNSFFSIVVTFTSMLILNVPLSMLSLFMVVILLTVARKIASQSSKHFHNQQNDLGRVNGFIEEMMDGQKVVKVFNHEERAKEDFRKINQQLRYSATNANIYANILMPVSANIGHISYVLCAMLGATLALHGYAGLTLGTLVSFLALNRSFANPITQISQQINSVIMAMAGADRVFNLLDAEVETDEGYVELVNATEDAAGNLQEVEKTTGMWAWKHPHEDGTVTYHKQEGRVTFSDVTFGYNDDKMVLHDINLFAEPGQKIAFVGSTGAGKTTITNLINRFYDIQEGKIHYDGINIRKIKKADLRRSLGIVLQDTHLFTGTVMDNIRYGRLNATDDECIAAAKLANAHDFIKRLPEGYDTILTGDGSNLSQGQRQLLAIARAAVANPPALILDEATSSIDTRTEVHVQEGMDALMKGRTTFVIAHRLSTVRNADCIMVLEQGRIIERGNHDELIAQKGRYYQLYTGNAISE